jgi:hypothetical protein
MPLTRVGSQGVADLAARHELRNQLIPVRSPFGSAGSPTVLDEAGTSSFHPAGRTDPSAEVARGYGAAGGQSRLSGGLISEQLAHDSDRLRATHPTFHESARLFAAELGDQFMQLLRSRVRPGKTAHVVVAMGGAEHLGNLIELALGPDEQDRIALHFVYLSQTITDPWRVVVENTINGNVYQDGIGPKPAEYLFDARSQRGAGNTQDELMDYLDSQGIWNRDSVLVVDTGTLGSAVEVVANLGRAAGFPGAIEGVLLQHVGKRVKHTTPVFGLNEYLSYDAGKTVNLDSWANLLDLGVSRDEEVVGEKETNPAVHAFRKSRVSPSHLVSTVTGWVPDTPLHDEPELVEQYAATILGLLDGLKHR